MRKKHVWLQLCLVHNWSLKAPFYSHDVSVKEKEIIKLFSFTHSKESSAGRPLKTPCWLVWDSDCPLQPNSSILDSVSLGFHPPLGPSNPSWRKTRCCAPGTESSLESPPLSWCQEKKEVEAEQLFIHVYCQCFFSCTFLTRTCLLWGDWVATE